MSQALIQSQDCCGQCLDVPITQIPGPQGDPGADGTNGTDGSNAFTETTDSFTMPAVSGNVTVDVLDSTWMAVGQIVFVENAGYFTVNSVPDAVSVSLTNLGYDGNAAPTTIIPSGQQVSPGGKKGTDGAAGSSTLNDLSPTNLKGDLIVDTGANNPDADDVRFARGTDGQILTSLTAQPVGLQWQSLLPNAATDNVLPRFDASGTTSPTPLQASGLLVTDDGALQSTPTGGNARGSKATDLQIDRSAATQVASGAGAIIPGGANNTASGISSFAAGDTNLASGDGAVAIGDSNTASASPCVAIGDQHTVSDTFAACLGGSTGTADAPYASTFGGFANFAHADYSAALGRLCGTSVGAESSLASGFRSVAYLYAQRAHSAGPFTDPGDAQTSDLLWRGTTANATPTELFIDGSAARATVPADTTWAFEIIGLGRRSDGMSICFKIDGGIKNDAGTVVLVAAVTTIVTADGTGAVLGAGNFVVSADDPNNALIITVTGQVAQDWRWVARARLVECGH